MATGVEMLGQMSEDMQLAGPVSGGNMVVKPNEAPVGAAAMLSKALRKEANKGVAGIYELPTPKEPLPDFMKAAKNNVNMQGDPMRGMGPREGLTPFDIANMSGAVEQAGIINFLGMQPEVTVPIRAKSHADAPPTQLAYITDAEKQMLINANMHGSLDGEANPGPGGVQSLDDFFNIPGGGVGGGSTDRGETYASAKDYGIGSGQAVGGSDGGTVFQKQDDGSFQKADEAVQQAAKEKAQQTKAAAQKAGETEFEEFKRERDEREKKLKDEQKKQEEANLKSELDVLNAKKDPTRDDKKRIKELNKKLKKIFAEQQKSLFDDTKKSVKDMDKDDIKKRLKELAALNRELTPDEERERRALRDATTNLPTFKGVNALDDLFGELVDADVDDIASPNTMSLVAYKQGLLNEDGTLTGKGENFATRYGDELEFLGIDDFGSYLEGIKGGVEGTESQRAIDRANYYLTSDQAKYYGATQGSLEQLGKEQLYSAAEMKAEKDPDRVKLMEKFNRKVIDARMTSRQNRDRNNQNQGGGGGRPAVVEEVESEAIVDADDMTMPYKGPRTGDKEIDVPLSRRFKTDPTKDVAQFTTAPRTQEDIFKYMTQGTTGEGITLEPFSEYQRRRRKALGSDPLGLYG